MSLPTGSDLSIIDINAKDLRWPTSLEGHGSDAMVCVINFFLLLSLNIFIIQFEL